MSFAAQIISQQARVYCLQYDRGTADSCYFFLQVDRAKLAPFEHALATGGGGKLTDFGQVIASGWGEPGVGVQETMSAKYGLTFKDAA